MMMFSIVISETIEQISPSRLEIIIMKNDNNNNYNNYNNNNYNGSNTPRE